MARDDEDWTVTTPSRTWERPVSVEPTPVVLVGACAPAGSQLPRDAAALIRAAQVSGWRVRATYALAEVPAWRHWLAAPSKVDGAKYRDIPAEMIESVAVRLWCPMARGVAVWRNRSFDSCWLVVDGHLLRFGMRVLAEYVRTSIVKPSEIKA